MPVQPVDGGPGHLVYVRPADGLDKRVEKRLHQAVGKKKKS